MKQREMPYRFLRPVFETRFTIFRVVRTMRSANPYFQRRYFRVRGNCIGIKRWTDGIPWSPSRSLTNFLIYRQLNQPFPPGEKKPANTKTQWPPGTDETHSTPNPTSNLSTADDHRSLSPPSQDSVIAGTDGQRPNMDSKRTLVGSLVDSYEFKSNNPNMALLHDASRTPTTVWTPCENGPGSISHVRASVRGGSHHD